jgi:dihydroorotase-like cyclic amidohydrolase
MQNFTGVMKLDFKIVDLNISPKSGKISSENIQYLQKLLKESGVIGYSMPQLETKIDSESELILLETLNNSDEVRFFPTLSGLNRDGSLSEIASLSSKIFAIYIESNIEFEKMKSIFQYAQMLKKPIICKVFSGSEVVYESENSYRFGHSGRSQLREPFEVGKVIEMSRDFGVKTLFQGVTVPRALELIENGKRDEIPLFLEMSINHILFDDSIYSKFDNLTKIDPPFQSKKNLEFIREFLKSGKIDMLTSLHRRNSEADKSGSFKESSFGMETLQDLNKKYLQIVENGFVSKENLQKMVFENQLDFLGVSEIGI